MSFQTIAVTEKENQLIIEILEKRIYLGVTDIFLEELSDVVQRNFDEMVIDLNHVSVMNSSGIGALIKTRDEVIKKDRKIKLRNLQPLMEDIFSRMRLDTLFEIENFGR